MNAKPDTAKIRELNDQLRKTGIGGRIMITAGIKSMGEKAIAEIVAKVRAFNQFTPDNDPYGEHDFGKIMHGHEAIFFKFAYYDRNMEYASPDPSDPKVTVRVMTIMQAMEY
ncbi:DUF3768 domain-containing protein [Azospirillaceae bacterium]